MRYAEQTNKNLREFAKSARPNSTALVRVITNHILHADAHL